jgi:type I restriction enzyme, R subunit
MQKVINAEKSDLFDVLAYVAYALPTLTCAERATNAKARFDGNFNAKQQASSILPSPITLRKACKNWTRRS